MSWIELSEDELLAVMNSSRLEGIRAAALAAGQEDPVQPVFDMVTQFVRAKIDAFPTNVLGEGETLPESLLLPALDICIYYIAKRVDQLTEEDREAWKEANALLDEVADGDVKIELPATADPTQSTTGSALVKKTTPTMSRETLDGL